MSGFSAAGEEQEILVGRTSAAVLSVRPGYLQPFALPVSIFPGISGYATGELGFHSTILDEPANDFFQLSTAADFRLILLAKDPGMEVWNDTGSGYLNIGQTFYVGPPPFDTHPIWDLVNGSPGSSYSLSLKLHDLNGVYPDASFTLSFTAEAAPGPFALTMNLADASHVMLCWPTNAVGWSLESADSLTANWVPITTNLSLADSNFSVVVTRTAPQAFFRLRKH